MSPRWTWSLSVVAVVCVASGFQSISKLTKSAVLCPPRLSSLRLCKDLEAKEFLEKTRFKLGPLFTLDLPFILKELSVAVATNRKDIVSEYIEAGSEHISFCDFSEMSDDERRMRLKHLGYVHDGRRENDDYAPSWIPQFLYPVLHSE